MDFGRATNLEKVDFRLPDDPPATAAFLRRLPEATTPATIYIGTPRWADLGYLGKIYPRGTKPAEFLEHYAKSFSTIELNTTYYGVDERAVTRWQGAVGPEFRFCPKLPKAITHDAYLRDVGPATERFCEQMRALGTNLGPMWALLPESFEPRQFQDLSRFVHEFPTGHLLAVELRHPRWFRDDAVAAEVIELFEENGTIAMITDVAGRRDVLHQRLTAPTAMIRFVGNRHHPSDFRRIDAWVDRLMEWFAAGLRELYWFLHQPDEHLVVEIAEYAADRFARAGIEVPRPRRVRDPQQGQLF